MIQSSFAGSNAGHLHDEVCRLRGGYVGTNHEHDQPSHLKLKDETAPEWHNGPLYAAMETRYGGWQDGVAWVAGSHLVSLVCGVWSGMETRWGRGQDGVTGVANFHQVSLVCGRGFGCTGYGHIHEQVSVGAGCFNANK